MTDVPLFEIADDDLVPFRRVPAGPDHYERHIEELLWANLEALTGVELFPIRRQARVGSGLIADILALDTDGHVVVIEVKRDVDRSQLAQSLEYAGWATHANLDQLASLYTAGAEAFFSDWMEFTGDSSPRLVASPPRLYMVARDIDPRTDAALDFLVGNGLPVTVLRVAMYEDQDKRRFLDIDSPHEPEFPADGDDGPTGSVPLVRSAPASRRILVADLMNAGLIRAGTGLIWKRPRSGSTYRAEVLENGMLRIEDGREFSSPSRAAVEAAGGTAFDGWNAWKVAQTGELLAEVRRKYVEAHFDAERRE